MYKCLCTYVYACMHIYILNRSNLLGCSFALLLVLSNTVYQLFTQHLHR